jgi:hypothetical protein
LRFWRYAVAAMLLTIPAATTPAAAALAVFALVRLRLRLPVLLVLAVLRCGLSSLSLSVDLL